MRSPLHLALGALTVLAFYGVAKAGRSMTRLCAVQEDCPRGPGALGALLAPGATARRCKRRGTLLPHVVCCVLDANTNMVAKGKLAKWPSREARATMVGSHDNPVCNLICRTTTPGRGCSGRFWWAFEGWGHPGGPWMATVPPFQLVPTDHCVPNVPSCKVSTAFLRRSALSGLLVPAC